MRDSLSPYFLLCKRKAKKNGVTRETTYNITFSDGLLAHELLQRLVF